MSYQVTLVGSLELEPNEVEAIGDSLAAVPFIDRIKLHACDGLILVAFAFDGVYASVEGEGFLRLHT